MGKSLVKNSIYNIFYKVITALYPLIAVTYVSHILQSERMGMVSYAQNIVSYFVVISALGIPTYGIKETAIRADDKRARSKLFFELFIINAISTTIALVLYMILIASVERFHNNLSLYIIAGLQITLNYFNVDWFYQGLEEYKYISIRSIIVKICALFLLPILVRTSDDYIYYALIYCLAIAGNNIFNIIRIRKYVQFSRCKLQFRIHLRPIFLLLIASIAVEIYVMIDTTMLGLFCDNTTVGCYSNAMKLTRTVNTMAAAIGAVLLPRLSSIFQKNDKKQFNDLVNSGIQIMLMVAIPASVGMILLSEEIIYVFFGMSFTDAIPILRILALMVPVVVCNTLLGGQVLVTTNMESKYVISVTLASIVNVCLNALFIPRYGAPSAAVASLISEIIDLVLYLWFTREYIRLKFSIRYVTSMGIPLIIFIIISKFGISKIEMNYIVFLIINVMTCLIVYFGVGLILKNDAMVLVFQKIRSIILKKTAQKIS